MFAAIEAAATDILRDVLQTQVGAVESGLVRQRSAERPTQAARFHVWLERQRSAYGTAVRAEELTAEAVAADPEWTSELENEMLDRLDTLQRELRDANGERLREVQLVDRLRKSAVVSKAVFPDEGQQDEKDSEVKALCQVRDSLVVEFLSRRREANGLQKQLTEEIQGNQRLRLANRQAMKELQELKEEMREAAGTASQSESVRQAEEVLKTEQARNVILRNTFQLLIVASGVDWAAKETLQELLLSLGEPLELP